MPDNLANFGLRDDEPVGSRRMKPKGKRRKTWVIEYRVPRRVSHGLAFMLRLRDWGVHSKYETKNRRDQAYAALVKKPMVQWGWEYRKVDP